jgi:transposase-like protein
VTRNRPAPFRGRHFEDVIILLCVRWYLRYSLTYRDLEEIMAERGLSVDHVTIWRWVQRYARKHTLDELLKAGIAAQGVETCMHQISSRA